MFKLETDNIIDGGGFGNLKFKIVGSLKGAGAQSKCYKAQIISSDIKDMSYAFIKNYYDIDLKQMGLLDNFYQKLYELIPTNDRLRICLPLNDSKTERYHPAIGQAGNVVFIAYRWVEGKTLGSWLNTGKFNDSDKKRIILAILHICKTLSRANIVHLDLKPDNFLITTCHGIDYLTLIDMDFARILDPTDKTYNGLRKVGGTPGYTSPEHYDVNDQKISDKTDVFSIAILLSQILLAVHPYIQCDNYFCGISTCNYTFPENDYHKNIIQCLKQCLQSAPNLRPTIFHVVSIFNRYAATLFRFQRCGFIITDGNSEYSYWKDTVLSNQDLRVFGILLPSSQGGVMLKIDQDNGEYGVRVFNASLKVSLNNYLLIPGKSFSVSRKNTLTIAGKNLTLLLIQE